MKKEYRTPSIEVLNFVGDVITDSGEPEKDNELEPMPLQAFSNIL